MSVLKTGTPENVYTAYSTVQMVNDL